jgi:hypothetical protein
VKGVVRRTGRYASGSECKKGGSMSLIEKRPVYTFIIFNFGVLIFSAFFAYVGYGGLSTQLRVVSTVLALASMNILLLLALRHAKRRNKSS